MASWNRGFDAAKSALAFSDGKRPGERMGAALFSGATLLSIGCNKYSKTHPSATVKGYNLSIHAEHSCLLKRQHYSNGRNLMMYVYRENFQGKPICSKPCHNCITLLLEADVKRVRYIDKGGQMKEIKL